MHNFIVKNIISLLMGFVGGYIFSLYNFPLPWMLGSFTISLFSILSNLNGYSNNPPTQPLISSLCSMIAKLIIAKSFCCLENSWYELFVMFFKQISADKRMKSLMPRNIFCSNRVCRETFWIFMDLSINSTVVDAAIRATRRLALGSPQHKSVSYTHLTLPTIYSV